MVPSDVKNIRNKSLVFVERGYGEVLGFNDIDYMEAGVNVVSREEALSKDIVCDPKIGDAEYLSDLRKQIVFGWIHAVQNKDIADSIIDGGLTAFAWEDMYDFGRHCFWRNNEIAGEAAIMHAYMCYGVFPYNTKVAVVGRGNTARGAIKTLNYMGANVVCYDRRTESLLRQEIGEYDVIVNAVLWDTKRKDHIISRDDLKRMKRNSMIVDISCDRNGGIETSIPTTIDNPTYMVDGVIHYVVDHTPSIFWRTASDGISAVVSKHVDSLISGVLDEVLRGALIVKDGKIIDERITAFQKRK